VKYRYYTCDVFTETRFAGNPLAVGRPSTLMARAEKVDGVVQDTWVGGASVLVSDGFIHLE